MKMSVSFGLVTRLFMFIGFCCYFSAAQGSVSDIDCTSNGNECSSTANSACDGSKCKCNPGFKGTTATCTKVLKAACKTASDCTTIVPNSNCSSTCVCTALYAEKDNLCIKSVSGTSCTNSGNECNSITNSACDVPNKKCKCNSGFKENVNKCAAESKATTLSTKTTTLLFAASLLTFFFLF